MEDTQKIQKYKVPSFFDNAKQMDKDCLEFENSEVFICTFCIDKKYPRETKIIEKPIIISKEKDKETKTDFEEKTMFE